MNDMLAAQSRVMSCMMLAAFIILTSTFSLKSLSSTTSAFKVEELAILHKSSSVRSKIYRSERELYRNEKANFVICNDCFWCASQIKMGDLFSRCPGCKKSNLETVPISVDEAYFFRCDSRGVELSFKRTPA